MASLHFFPVTGIFPATIPTSTYVTFFRQQRFFHFVSLPPHSTVHGRHTHSSSVMPIVEAVPNNLTPSPVASPCWDPTPDDP